MAEERYHLLWRGQTVGPYSIDEIKKLLADREIVLSYQIDDGEGNWIFLEDFLSRVKEQEKKTVAGENASKQESEGASGAELTDKFYLALGGKTEGPYEEAEVCGFIEKGTVAVDTQAQAVGTGVWRPLSQLHQFAGSISNRKGPKLQETEVFSDDGPAEIMVLVGGKRYGPYTVGQVRAGAQNGTIDGRAVAKRPSMPGWVPLMKWPEFKQVNFAFSSAASASSVSSASSASSAGITGSTIMGEWGQRLGGCGYKFSGGCLGIVIFIIIKSIMIRGCGGGL